MKAATGAYVGAALFVCLIVAFSTLGNRPPTGPLMALIGALGVSSHLVLLPVVCASGSTGWTRACGYSWIAIDVMLNVAAVNGMALPSLMPLRLGGHVLAAVWIADAAVWAGGLVKAVGIVLAALLAFHALAAPWIPAWFLFIPFALIPAWLALVGWQLQRRTTPTYVSST
jgi:hypothetical protein